MQPLRSSSPFIILFLILGPLSSSFANEPASNSSLISISIEPNELTLDGPTSGAQLILNGLFADGSQRDLTREAMWFLAPSSLARIEGDGYLEPIANGAGGVVARIGSFRVEARVKIQNIGRVPALSFERDLLPALSKAGCNQGACHGTPTGKNGFKLSLRGFNAPPDFDSITRESSSRRINRLDAAASLLLLKGTGAVPHQGGQRFSTSSLPYKLACEWIAQGAKPDPPNSPTLLRIEVFPTSRVIDAPARDQQLLVRASYSHGASRDVTRLARFTSSDESLAAVDSFGLVRKKSRRGEATILIHLGSEIATAQLVFREPVPTFVWNNPPQANFIDRHLFDKLQVLRILPSNLADDSTFIRRVFLDAIGVLPTPAEVRAFLADTRANKRLSLIDALLDRPEYIDFWTLKWSDRLGCNQRFVGLKGAYSYHRWIRDQVAANVPFDTFARTIITAKGSNYTNPPASFYRRLRNPEEAAETVSQLFLGVRMQCAKCHNHVSERWTQNDYYGLAAFFSQVRFKDGPQAYELYDKEETVYLFPSADLKHPRSGATMRPKPLLAPPSVVPPGNDRRDALADWVVSKANPFFARAAVNRIWYHLLGRGIVEPVDDIRDSNPPASAPLLQALAEDFVAHGFDVKQTIRLILNSRTYQLASAPNPSNAEDNRYFSHASVRLLSAEQLLDAVSQVTGVSEPLFHLPPGTRAAQIPDGEFSHPFLRSFGQPLRSVACECERETDSTLEQALQLVGGRTVHAKLTSSTNRLTSLLRARDDGNVVSELFLSALSRLPTDDELTLALAPFHRAPLDRRRAAEDLLWSLINHSEFLFQH